MSLPLTVRVLLRTQSVLTRLGALPDAHKALTRPHADRLALKAPKALLGKVPDVDTADAEVRTRDGATIRVRTYRSAHATDRPLVYLHGGGFCLGGLDVCDHICRRLADESGSVVVSVEYRLAPEHRFPVPLQDGEDALDWVVAHAAELGVDPLKLVVAGDSGGGNLAAALAVVLRDAGRPLSGQLLIYPGVDLSMSLPWVKEYRGGGLTTADVELCCATYLGDHDPTDPYASPLYADATGLAPAFVLTVGHDPLKGEGVAYAEKLLAAGVPVQHLDLPDHVHGSLSVPRLYEGVDEVYARMSAFVAALPVGSAT